MSRCRYEKNYDEIESSKCIWIFGFLSISLFDSKDGYSMPPCAEWETWNDIPNDSLSIENSFAVCVLPIKNMCKSIYMYLFALIRFAVCVSQEYERHATYCVWFIVVGYNVFAHGIQPRIPIVRNTLGYFCKTYNSCMPIRMQGIQTYFHCFNIFIIFRFFLHFHTYPAKHKFIHFDCNLFVAPNT